VFPSGSDLEHKAPAELVRVAQPGLWVVRLISRIGGTTAAARLARRFVVDRALRFFEQIDWPDPESARQIRQRVYPDRHFRCFDARNIRPIDFRSFGQHLLRKANASPSPSEIACDHFPNVHRATEWDCRPARHGLSSTNVGLRRLQYASEPDSWSSANYADCDGVRGYEGPIRCTWMSHQSAFLGRSSKSRFQL